MNSRRSRAALLTATFLSLTSASALLLVSSCSDDDDDRRSFVNPPPSPNGGGDVDGSVSPPPPTDDGGIRTSAQIMSIVVTANTGEVAQGQVAQTKAANANVKSYADMMVTEHGAANQRAAALAQQLGETPQDNAVSQQLKAESDAIVTQLSSLPAGAAFDRAYIESQVTVHTKVLAIIDNTLLPVATNDALRTELTTMRTSVATHLQQAQTILTTVTTDGGFEGGVE